MKPLGKVVWGEGMFLTQHLFQQADRYQEQVLDFRLRAGQLRLEGFERMPEGQR